MSASSFDDRWPENVPGKFYVDQACLDCSLCGETAPELFTRNEEGGYYYISRQPSSKDEEELLQETIEGCPCEAIFADGDQFDWKSGIPLVRDSIGERQGKIESKQCGHCSQKPKPWWRFWS